MLAGQKGSVEALDLGRLRYRSVLTTSRLDVMAGSPRVSLVQTMVFLVPT